MSLWVYYLDDLDFGYSIRVSEDGKTVNITFRGFEEYCTDRILVESLKRSRESDRVRLDRRFDRGTTRFLHVATQL